MFASWRDQILAKFAPQAASLTAVDDPDGLLAEERVQQELRNRGYSLIWFEDPIAFRLLYERDFRARWDRDENAYLLVVWPGPTDERRHLPFDVEIRARHLSFCLADLFPRLDAGIVAALDRESLDRLYEATLHHTPQLRTETETKDYVLRHVFGISPETIDRPAELMRILLRRHHHGARVPAILDEYLVRGLRRFNIFREWPLEDIVPNQDAFLEFLQDQWPRYLTGAGDLLVPFEHTDVRIYVRDLFSEGRLRPVEWTASLPAEWACVGVRRDGLAVRKQRADRLRQIIEETLPLDDAPYSDWLAFAPRWGQLTHTDEPSQELREQVEMRFGSWIAKRYAGLHNQPGPLPAMVHQIPRWMRRLRESTGHVAIVVIDCLSVSQWPIVRQALEPFRLSEHAAFAWVPTLTSVSRQSIFSGKPPYAFANTISTTAKEPEAWQEFWLAERLRPDQILYHNFPERQEFLDDLEAQIVHKRPAVAGIVVRGVDEIAHGMTLGAAGMQQQVQQWVERGYVSAVIGLLVTNGYRVVLTADHGNVEARGCGRLNEGVIAELRGERVRVYPSPASRDLASSAMPGSVPWQPVGLPNLFYPLLAPAGAAFVHHGDCIVSHGGASLEEVIVPLIEVAAR